MPQTAAGNGDKDPAAEELALLPSFGAGRRPAVLISESVRLIEAGDPVLGMWEGTVRRIVIRRDHLSGLARYAGTLLHVRAIALSG